MSDPSTRRVVERNDQKDTVMSSADSNDTAISTSDRTELIQRARTFLQSPQIINQDPLEKRRFLLEKGLNEVEIESLLRDFPLRRPPIPPRTYPPLPPSSLPNLLLGITRILSWLTGGAATLIFVYYRFLLPRISSTASARQILKMHQLSLLRKLNGSLQSLKVDQAETHALLPKPEPPNEGPKFSACNSITDILKELGDNEPDYADIPSITLLRCGIQKLSKAEDGHVTQPTTEEIFQYLENQISWLTTEDGLKYERRLWETLSTSSLFAPAFSQPVSEGENSDTKRWAYVPPAHPEPSPVQRSLDTLHAVLPKDAAPQENSRQHTLQALSDFTGFISTQVYMPYGTPNPGGFFGAGSLLGPTENEFRREIRALKGLVLNRRSFMSPRPDPTTP